MLPIRKESDEILYAEGDLVGIGYEDIVDLKRLAALTPRRRCRICTHVDRDAALHEMLIVHEKNTWIPPHKHVGKDESIHVIEGSAILVTFTEDGKIARSLRLDRDERFYCRMPVNTFHTLLIESDWFVFHETTLGPFDRSRTVFAPWAPANEGAEAVEFATELRARLAL